MSTSTTKRGSSAKPALAQLAARCGIAAEYQDIWGKRHATTDRTRRALLAAMHFPAKSDPAALLQEMDEREWRRPLPPVLVLHAGNSPMVPVSLPEVLVGQTHRWILTAEDGTTTSNDFLPADLPRIGDLHLDGASFLRTELKLPPLLEAGYYRLEVEQPGRDVQPQAAMSLIVTPPTAFQPRDADDPTVPIPHRYESSP